MLRKTWMADGFEADPAGLASNPDKLMPGSPEPDINLTTKPNDREEQHVQGAEDDQGLCKNMVIGKGGGSA